MLTVRNLRQKPEPEADKRLVWFAGIIVFALFVWTVHREYQNYQRAETPQTRPGHANGAVQLEQPGKK